MDIKIKNEQWGRGSRIFFFKNQNKKVIYCDDFYCTKTDNVIILSEQKKIVYSVPNKINNKNNNIIFY